MVKLTTTIFIEKAILIHGFKYDYSKVNYIDSKTKVCIICKEHGEFWQNPSNHLNRKGCKECANKKLNRVDKITVEEAMRRLDNLNNNYEYDLTNFKKSKDNIKIKCGDHGWFEQSFQNHTLLKYKCPKCSTSEKYSKEKFINKCIEKKINSFEYYDLDSIENLKSNINIKCNKHGLITTTVFKHLYTKFNGCKKCSVEHVNTSNTKSTEDFISELINEHGDIFILDKIDYKGYFEEVELGCKIHGYFKHKPDYILRGCSCPKCSKSGVSKAEKEIYNFIKSNIEEEVIENLNILDGKEIDIYIPDLKIGIEYNGLYWHSELYKENNYHLDKLELAKSKGIRLIQIFEDEWLNKKEIVKSRLLNILGKTQNRIYARKCEIREISSKECRKFLDENHIQGFTSGKIYLGLYNECALVSCMVFGGQNLSVRGKSNGGGDELNRFCNSLNTTVIGGASKLMKYFIKNYNPQNVISYADRRWSEGELYEKIGFDFKDIIKPNYTYFKKNSRDIIRHNKYKFRIKNLNKKFNIENKTEREAMKELEYLRIYDCGKIKVELKIKN